jgi:phage-related protein
MANDIKIALNLDGTNFSKAANDAQTRVKDLSDALKKLKGPVEDGLGGAFGSLKGAVGGIIDTVFSLKGALAGVASAFAAGKIIEAAIEAEQALNAVANSLRLSGELSADALKDVQDFAGALQDVTGLGDDTTLSMLALAQSFGLSKDEAKKAVSAAVDLSAATGKDLNTSVEMLSKSYNGNVKALALLNPEVKSLTKEQLAAGAAVDKLSEQYAGSAAQRLKTFGGAVGSLKTRFGDLLEEIGFLVTKNPAVIASVREVEGVIRLLGTVIAENADSIRQWVTGAITDFLTGLNLSVRALGLFGEAVGETSSLELPSIFTKAGIAVAFLSDQFLAAKETYARLKFEFESDNIQGAITQGMTVPPEAFENLQRLKDSLDEVRKAREDLSTAVARAEGTVILAPDTSKFSKAVDDIKAKLNGLPSTVSIDVNAKGGRGVGGGKDAREGGGKDEEGETVKEGLEAFLARLGSEQGALAMKDLKKQQQKDRDADEKRAADIEASWTAGMLSFAAASAKALAGGAEGARSALSGLGAAAADAFFPGAGQAVGPLIDALSQGPEAVRGMVNSFADAIPGLLENIAEAIPVLVETLADRMPDIIVALVKATPKITVALIKAFSDPRTYAEIAKGLAQAAVEGARFQQEKFKESTQQFKDGVGEATRKTTSGLQQIGPFLVQAMQKAGDTFAQFIYTLPEKLGEAFQSTFDFLSQGIMDVWTTFSTVFTEGIPSLFTAMLEGIGPFIEGFGTALTEVFSAAVTEIGLLFSETVPEALAALGEKFTAVFGGLPEVFATVWQTLRDGFASAFQDIPQALIDAVKGAFDALIPGGGGGKKGPVTGIPGSPLATGGIVKGKGNRDSVPAILAPGELVLDRTTGPRLNAFIDRAEQNAQSPDTSDGTTMALLAKIVGLLQQPITVETEATIDGRTMADIILKLNRTNQRLA